MRRPRRRPATPPSEPPFLLPFRWFLETASTRKIRKKVRSVAQKVGGGNTPVRGGPPADRRPSFLLLREMRVLEPASKSKIRKKVGSVAQKVGGGNTPVCGGPAADRRPSFLLLRDAGSRTRIEK